MQLEPEAPRRVAACVFPASALPPPRYSHRDDIVQMAGCSHHPRQDVRRAHDHHSHGGSRLASRYPFCSLILNVLRFFYRPSVPRFSTKPSSIQYGHATNRERVLLTLHGVGVLQRVSGFRDPEAPRLLPYLAEIPPQDPSTVLVRMPTFCPAPQCTPYRGVSTYENPPCIRVLVINKNMTPQRTYQERLGGSTRDVQDYPSCYELLMNPHTRSFPDLLGHSPTI
jgi:hypothetical protein